MEDIISPIHEMRCEWPLYLSIYLFLLVYLKLISISQQYHLTLSNICYNAISTREWFSFDDEDVKPDNIVKYEEPPSETDNTDNNNNNNNTTNSEYAVVGKKGKQKKKADNPPGKPM